MITDLDLEANPPLMSLSPEIDSGDNYFSTDPSKLSVAKNESTQQLFFEIDALGKKTHFSRLVREGDKLTIGVDTSCDIILEHSAVRSNNFTVHIGRVGAEGKTPEIKIITQGSQVKVMDKRKDTQDTLVQMGVLQIFIGFQNREKITSVDQATFDLISRKPSRVAGWLNTAILFSLFFVYFLFKTMTLGYVSTGGGDDASEALLLGEVASVTIFFSWALDIAFIGFFSLLLMLDFRFFRKYRIALNQAKVKLSMVILGLYIIGSIMIYGLYYIAPYFMEGIPNLYNLWWVACVSLFFWRSAKLSLVSTPNRQLFKNLFIVFIFAFWIIQNYGLQANTQSVWYPQKHNAPSTATTQEQFESFLTKEIEAARE